MVNSRRAAHRKRGHEGPEGEQKYSFTLFLNLVPDGGGWSKPCSSCFVARNETQYSLQRRLGGLQAWSGQLQKISNPLGFHSRTVQPVASHYTDYTILVHHITPCHLINDYWLCKGLSVTIYPSIQYNIPEDSHIPQHHCQNIQSCKVLMLKLSQYCMKYKKRNRKYTDYWKYKMTTMMTTTTTTT